MWRCRKFWSTCLILHLLIVALLVGCNPYSSPSDAGVPNGPTTIRHLRVLYEGYPLLLTHNPTIEGVVVSNDRFGEFRRMVTIEDATGGITVMVASDSLYLLHRVGDVLRVECGGLTLGGVGGAVRLGDEGVASQVEPLGIARWKEHYDTVGVADTLPYRDLSIGEVSAEHLSTRLLLRGVRFVEAGEEWAPQRRDTTRHLVDCSVEGDTLAVRLSGRSRFASATIPEGECSLFGVLDYCYEGYQLRLASPEDVLPHSEN